MQTIFCLVTALLLTHPVPVLADADDADDPDGAPEWQLCANATRSLMFLDLYSVDVHLRDCSPYPPLSNDAFNKEPLMFRISVHWDRDKPEQLPGMWQEELMPVCTTQQQASLMAVYREVGKGDIVDITFAPGAGTRITMNQQLRLTDPGYEVLKGFMDLWFKRSPLARELTEAR